jgi:hypothetical protein
MNIVEKEAKDFIEDFYKNGEVNSLEKLKSQLTIKLSDFNWDRDKLDFLKILRQDTNVQKENHLKECQREGCDFPKDRDMGLFAIDQEIDDINKYYTFTPKPNDTFTSEEESKLHSKLNEIIDQLKKQGFGQEIIFEEIESLKNHFNLGKRTWFQLLKGKVIDLTLEKVLEKTIVKEIYDNLSDGYTEVVKLID